MCSPFCVLLLVFSLVLFLERLGDGLLDDCREEDGDAGEGDVAAEEHEL